MNQSGRRKKVLAEERLRMLMLMVLLERSLAVLIYAQRRNPHDRPRRKSLEGN